MPFMKSIFPALLSMLLIANAWAWYPGNSNYSPYFGPYANRNDPSLNVRKGIQIKKDMDERGYILRIQLTGMTPEAIEMKIVRGTLLLRSSQASLSRDASDYGERTFSHSFSMNKRIRLPYDADISKTERNDGPGLIEIRFPRRQWN